MKLYHPFKQFSVGETAEIAEKALKDDKYLSRLVADGWCLSTTLQLRLFDLHLHVLENYLRNNSLDKEAEVMLCELEDDDLLDEYIGRHAVLLGKTLISQEFILALFKLSEPSANRHLLHCIREGVWFSPEVQVKLLKAPYGQDLLLRYLVPHTKYAHWINESRRDEIPLCQEAQMLLFDLPNAKEVIWFLTQTWKLCPKAEEIAGEKGFI